MGKSTTVQPIRNKQKIEEIKNVLKTKSERDYFLFVMGINCGLRISDMLQLTVREVLGKQHIKIKESKTDKYKRFRINATLQNEILKYTTGMNEDDYLFPSRKGDRPITRVQAYRILNEVAAQVGLEEIGTHTLRKTFGYHFYQKTKDVAMLQDIFNHSAPSVTKRYIGISQDEIDEAIDNFSL
ncbi:integrase [Evansella vedderi]|uniref:Integrase n=1 Tax=Evansella vedderi TaxID=38282 RepID=A0ABU0A395_9BACI|nr:site-specific integrase [Evansella vedderi]MDQ0257961.1 integrase [Evansella vedderi]